MATFEDCGHGKQEWLALKDFKTREIVGHAKRLSTLTTKVGKKGLVFTLGCVQCELASTKQDP